MSKKIGLGLLGVAGFLFILSVGSCSTGWQKASNVPGHIRMSNPGMFTYEGKRELDSGFLLGLIAVVTAFFGVGFMAVSSSSSKPIDNNPVNVKQIGNTEAICPHCDSTLNKKPARKTKCPTCGSFMYVRTRPTDHEKVIVTESQAEEIDKQWMER